MSNNISPCIVILLVLNCFLQIFCTYIEMDVPRKPAVERNNIINKGIWVRNKAKDLPDAAKLEEFIFRPNSMDVDNLLQGDFNQFPENNAQNGLSVLSYVERSRRSAGDDIKGDKINSKDCNSKNCAGDKNTDEKMLMKSKILTSLKPASVFNNYPFEIAVLLDNTRRQMEKVRNASDNTFYPKDQVSFIIKKDKQDDKSNITVNIETLAHNNDNFKDLYNITNDADLNATTKRSKKYGDDTLTTYADIDEDCNKTGRLRHNVDRLGLLNAWDTDRQRLPIKHPGISEQNRKNRPLTERGLLKILSMLTKTFKKIMRQHDDIRSIHKKMHAANKEFLRQVDVVSDKFKDFDSKYLFLVKLNEKLQLMDEKYKVKEEHFSLKETELEKNLLEFESQQKKFLSQQKQFYNIQKLMLAQNEKISTKQTQIAKTQSEISHRQNNFARILKKAKQVYTDKPSTTKPGVYDTTSPQEAAIMTTISPVSTESIKINLFSIPAISRLLNQDHLLLSEKDEQPVDELVYKYYFNNTFIDSLIKNKILTSVASTAENFENKQNKNKRDETPDLQNTLLLPIKKESDNIDKAQKTLNRRRRWIRKHSGKKGKGRSRGNKGRNMKDDNTKIEEQTGINFAPLFPTGPLWEKTSPYIIMATNFCNGIGQNENKQVLDWCIEKALRRLESMVMMPADFKLISQSDASTQKASTITIKPQRLVESSTTPLTAKTVDSTVMNSLIEGSVPGPTAPGGSSTSPGVSTVQYSYTPSEQVTAGITMLAPSAQNLNMFFPDNDQLESNLKKYELKPDLEGNFYYDGSLHASEVLVNKESDGFSDIMQLESNSRIDIDPATFDIQAKRRAYLRRLYDKTSKKTGNKI